MINDLGQTTPEKQTVKISQSVWVLFSLEVLNVLVWFSLLFYQAARGPVKYGKSIAVPYIIMVSILFFVILNIIGLFIYRLKLREYKELNQKPPMLLNVLIFFSDFISITVLLLLILIIFNNILKRF